MKSTILFLCTIVFITALKTAGFAQINQTVNNGAKTAPVVFPAGNCKYTWFNSDPSIGLTASGTGNIASFTALNTGNSPVTATITATPVFNGRAYIANNGSNTVTVINTATYSVVTTIPVGSAPSALCISPDGSRVYVSNYASNTVSVINTSINAVIATIPVGQLPRATAINADGSLVYVTNQYDNTLSVIATSSNTVVATIPGFVQPYCLAFRPKTNLLYVVNINTISVVNTTNNTIIQTIPVGQGLIQIVISPDGSKAFTTDQGGNDISVINTATNKVIAMIPLDGFPYGETISPDGNFLYVSFNFDHGAHNIAVIDTRTDEVIATLNNSEGVGIDVTGDGNYLYVANTLPGTTSVLNTRSGELVATIPIGKDPLSLGSFIANGPACTDPTVQITITVNPTVTTPTIFAGNAVGTTSSCTNAASVSPNIQQFDVSGSHLTGGVIGTAPPGFEVSLSPGSGYSNSITIPSLAGTANNTVVYVRLAASASSGNVSGNIILASDGAVSQSVAVSGIISQPLSPTVTISASSTSVCEGDSANFKATAVNGGTAPVYQWMVNGRIRGTNAPSFSISTLNNGDVITCSLMGSALCSIPPVALSNSIIMNVVLPVRPAVSITSSANNICQKTSVTFMAVAVNGGNSPAYQWMVNGVSAGTNSAEFTSNALNNGDVVNCLLSSNAACVISTDATSNIINITVNPSPVLDAGGDKTINEGSLTMLDATATGDIADITWSPSTGLNSNKLLEPTANPAVTTTYTLTVQGKDGCLATDTVTVNVINPLVSIPNTFTPNGDGVNDFWNIRSLDYYTNCTVQIFNRFGQKLYSSVGYGTPWNGTYNGAALPVGTYYYIINLNDKDKPLSGWVTIVR